MRSATRRSPPFGEFHHLFAVVTGAKLLFVYGTLRRGSGASPAAALQAQARWLGVATTHGRLYDIGGYPGFTIEAGGPMVEGDLFEMTEPEALLPLLDAYEECSADFPEPHDYRRERITVHLRERPTVAWTYVYARATNGLTVIGGWDAASGQARP